MSDAADELDGGDELPSVIHVTDDLDEYVEKERYKAIFRAKQEAAETLRDFGNPAALADSPAQLQIIREKVSAAVVSYITEIRRILEETEQGQELWANTRIETLPVDNATVIDGDVSDVTPTAGLTPVEHTPKQTHNTTHNRKTVYDLDGNPQPLKQTFTNDRNPDYYYVIDGVADYLALHDTEAEATYLTERAGKDRGHKRETVVIDPYAPIPLSRDVYQRLTRLLTDTGLDVELGEPDDDEWEL
jgi:hypothetical protein